MQSPPRLDTALFAHPIDQPKPVPIRFPDTPEARGDVAKQCAFDKRAQRIQDESERQIKLLRSAHQEGHDIGFSQGWAIGARFGFGLGLALACVLIAMSLLVAAKVGGL